MKRQKSIQVLVLIFAVMFLIIWFTDRPVKIVKVPVRVEVPVEVPPRIIPPQYSDDMPDTRKNPEFRGPPLKMYKPGAVQQMGVLNDPLTNETLPLFGREVNGRRDQYNYYTTLTNGNQVYSVPITFNNRECMDTQVGCNEFYGNEKVSILGRDNEFDTKIYRTENFF